MKKEKLSKEMKYLMCQKSNHKGEWLTIEAAKEYYKRACEISNSSKDDAGQFRKLRIEFQERYGLTELEAINILNGYYASDYVNKYYRIKNLIPLLQSKTKIIQEDENDERW